MIKIICDKCGCECGATAMLMTTEIIDHPNPANFCDKSSTKITDDHRRLRYVLCSACYQALHLPNPYISKDELDWEDQDQYWDIGRQ